VPKTDESQATQAPSMASRGEIMSFLPKEVHFATFPLVYLYCGTPCGGCP
jgi:hypothetical protein